MTAGNTTPTPTQPQGPTILIGFRYEPRTKQLWFEPQGAGSIRFDQARGAFCFELATAETQTARTTPARPAARSRSGSHGRGKRAKPATMAAGAAQG